MKRELRYQRIGLGLLLAVLVVIMVFPLLIALSTSFKSLGEIRAQPYRLIPETFQWQNYPNAMQKGEWGRYFLNSLFITVVTTLISLFTNSMAGYAFSRLRFPGRNALFGFSLFGMMVPMQAIMIPMFLRIRAIPFAGGNDWLGMGGSGLINSVWGVMLPMLAGPFGVFLCKQFFQSLPRALDEAAKIDGCSAMGIYLRIYLPLSKPALATLAILKATDGWNQYLWPLLVTQNEADRTVQLALSMFRGSAVVQWDLLMAATVLVSLPILALFLSLQKYYVQGTVLTGLKG